MPPSHGPQPFLGLCRAQPAEGYLIFLSCQVTEGPVDEIIRPRPQGSSPVYEYATEAASFGVPVSLLPRDPQAEGRCRCGATGGYVSFITLCGQLPPICAATRPCPAAHWAAVTPVPPSSRSPPAPRTPLQWSRCCGMAYAGVRAERAPVLWMCVSPCCLWRGPGGGPGSWRIS